MAKYADSAEMSTPAVADGIRLDEEHDGKRDAELTDDAVSGAEGSDPVIDTDEVSRSFWRRLASPLGAVIAGAIMVVALGYLTGWLGYRVHEDHQARAERDLFIQAARQGVINLTTMDHTSIEADIKRILDSTTGAFHSDFEARSKPFAQVVRQAQSKSEGTVSSAAIASQDGDQAQVLLTVAVKMSNVGAPEQPPRSWRMRIEVQKTGDVAKVSNVQFVT